MKELNKVLGENEKVLWEGTPGFWPYFLGGSLATTIIGLIWMSFMSPFIALAIKDIASGSHLFGFGIFLLPHFWIGIALLVGVPLYLYLNYKYTYYAITDKRLIMQKGIIGRDFDFIDFDQITNASVNVGLFDRIFGNHDTGTILISTAGSFSYNKNSERVNRPYALVSIEKPYEVIKFFNKVVYDVKTDIQYPNDLRPKENPGYQTNYDPNKLNSA